MSSPWYVSDSDHSVPSTVQSTVSAYITALFGRQREAGIDDITMPMVDRIMMREVTWAFLACLHVPLFEFDMRVHTVSDWMKLAGPVLRATVERCAPRPAFVYVYWQFDEEEDSSHSTIFFFDVAARLQVFFDPSTACEACVPGTFELFRTEHFWDKQPGAICKVVDADLHTRKCQNVQQYFEPRNGSGGLCMKVCLLFLVCCLRFRCWDLQLMADTVRKCVACRFHSVETWTLPGRLVGWAKQFSPEQPRGAGTTDNWTSREALLKLCEVRVDPLKSAPAQCGVFLGRGRVCTQRPCPGWALCQAHLRETFGIDACSTVHPVLDERWVEPRYVTYAVPDVISPPKAPGSSTVDHPHLGTVLYAQAGHMQPSQLTATLDNLDGSPGRFTLLRLDHHLEDGLAAGLPRLRTQLTATPWGDIQRQNPRLMVELIVPYAVLPEADTLPGGGGTRLRLRRHQRKCYWKRSRWMTGSNCTCRSPLPGGRTTTGEILSVCSSLRRLTASAIRQSRLWSSRAL